MLLLWKFCTKITMVDKKEHTCKLTNKGTCKKKEKPLFVFLALELCQFTQVVYNDANAAGTA